MALQIVGSTNASRLSEDTLLEAAVKITDAKIASAARRFINSVAGKTVTPAYLRLCARWQAESAPARRRLRQPSQRSSKAKLGKARLFILGSEPDEFDTRKSDDQQAQSRIKTPREFVREPLRWIRPPAFREQDQVIIAHLDRKRLQVFPPGRFLFRGKTFDGAPVIYLEQPRAPIKASARKFRKLVTRSFGIRRTRVPTRRIPRAWVAEFLQLWPKGYSAPRSRR